MGYKVYSSPEASRRAMFPAIKVYAKMWLSPSLPIVNVWFDKDTFSLRDIYASLPAGHRNVLNVRVEHIKHSSRFFCGSYGHNTIHTPEEGHRLQMLVDNGYALAWSLHLHFNNSGDAIAFFDAIAVMMRRMEPKRCRGCSLEMRCRVDDACATCGAAAKRIQKAFRRSIADPGYMMCRRRLMREAAEMNDELSCPG